MCCTEPNSSKPCGPIPRPISAAAFACSGRAPNIAAAAARPSGKASLRSAATASAGLPRSTSSIPSARCRKRASGTALAWTSVTTGNLAGIDLWLDEAKRGTLKIETSVVSGEIDLASLADNTVAFDGGMLGRKLSVYRLPENDWSRHVTLDHTVTFPGGCGSSGLCPRHAGGRQSGLVEPDLPDRVEVRPIRRRAPSSLPSGRRDRTRGRPSPGSA